MDLRSSLLKEIQQDIPLCEEPFSAIAERLGVSEEKVLEELKRLKEEKIVRQISPIYDTRRAGYDSSLVAFRVEDIEKAAEFINTYPGVSHNYEREDSFNLWFTLAVPPDADYTLEELVEFMAKKVSAREYAVLRTVRTFKIGVRLSFESLYEREEKVPEVTEPDPVDLSPEEKEVIRLSQEDLPLTKRPFREPAQKMGIPESEFVEVLRNLRERKVMRRFSAILYHRRAGFKANGMAVWRVEEERVEEVGRFFASFKAVSHCYERTTSNGWKYNLFTMIHGRERKEVEEFVRNLAREKNLKDYKVLFSTREFKKKRVKLFSEEFYRWKV